MKRTRWTDELIELLELAEAIPFDGKSPKWVNGFVPRSVRGLGRSPQGRILRGLYRLTRKVPELGPFDITRLRAHAGQSHDDWLLAGTREIEVWLFGLASADDDAVPPHREDRSRAPTPFLLESREGDRWVPRGRPAYATREEARADAGVYGLRLWRVRIG